MQKVWWKEAVVYQVYWRSFYDTDGDGYGDLQGVLEKLDYIQGLGVDVIWLNPCYESPDVDNGYDISDYYRVMRKAGTMEVWQQLLDETHRRGMKLIMDLVVNHTSTQHPWFMEARKSKDNPYRDYYIWRARPNNWRSYFTPSTWEWDANTHEYYFHSFAVEQPDLNWENPVVREEIYRMMRFWLDKGIDGFRLDAIALLAKQHGFPDAANPEHISYLTNQPKVHDYLREMNENVFSRYDIFTVGEIAFVTPEDGLKYVDEKRHELNTLFHFQVLDEMPIWDLSRFKEIQESWYTGLWGRGWNSQFLNNHDHTRLVTRYGNDTTYRVECAKCFATMLHTLPGTPYIYQGEEIGMTGVRFPSIQDYQDIAFINKYQEEVAKGKTPTEVFEDLLPLARDNSRTPMQWDASENAGFTTGKPWIPVNPNYREINVTAEMENPKSVYHYYKRLVLLRKQHDVMIYGNFTPILEDEPDVYGYTRRLEDQQILVLLNFAERETTVTLPDHFDIHSMTLLLHNYDMPPTANETKSASGTEQGVSNTGRGVDITKQPCGKEITLKPYEARMYLGTNQ